MSKIMQMNLQVLFILTCNLKTIQYPIYPNFKLKIEFLAANYSVVLKTVMRGKDFKARHMQKT